MLNFLTCLSTTFSIQAVKALVNLCVCAWADPQGTGGPDPPPSHPPPPPPLKNHNTIGFPSNTGPDLQKNHKVTKPVFNVGPSYIRQGLHWRADVGPLMVVFGPSLPSSTKKKSIVKVGPPLAKLSGSVQVIYIIVI